MYYRTQHANEKHKPGGWLAASRLDCFSSRLLVKAPLLLLFGARCLGCCRGLANGGATVEIATGASRSA